MSLMNQLERRFGWIAFPGFLRFYAILNALVCVLLVFRPHLGSVLAFDSQAILHGQVWRLITFLFYSGRFGGIGLIFLVFVVLIAFMISDALESAWGVFRASLFYYTGIATLILGNFLFPGISIFWSSGFMIYMVSFLAFATLYPKVEFLLWFILPVQVRILAWLDVGGMLLLCFMDVRLLPFFLLVHLNYFLWAGIPVLRGTAQIAKSAKRRRKFQTAKQPEGTAFHECSVCGRTDLTDPELVFRVGGDGEEYCEEHLPKGGA